MLLYYHAVLFLHLQNVPHYIQAIQWNSLSKMIEIYLFLAQLEDSIADIQVEVWVVFKTMHWLVLSYIQDS